MANSTPNSQQNKNATEFTVDFIQKSSMLSDEITVGTATFSTTDDSPFVIEVTTGKKTHVLTVPWFPSGLNGHRRRPSTTFSTSATKTP